MLDPKLIRNHLEEIAPKLATRGFELDKQAMNGLEERRKSIQTHCESLQSESKARAKKIGAVKASGGDIAPLLKEVGDLKSQLAKAEGELSSIQKEWELVVSAIPNIPDEDVPPGVNEDDNVELRTWGEPKPFDFEVKDHVDLGAELGQLDFEVAVKITGSRFAVMKSHIARYTVPASFQNLRKIYLN